MMPSSRIEAASSLRDSSSNSCRGCPGLGLMRDSFISLIDDDPPVFTSSIVMRASSPRPRAFRLMVVISMFFFTPAHPEVVYSYFFSLLMSSLASCMWLRAPLELGSYMSTGIPWLGASLNRILRCMTVSKTSSRKCFFNSS